MIGEENEKHLLFIKMFVVGITYFIIGVCLLLFIGVSKVNAAQTLNTWNGSTQGESCSNCNDLSFGNQRGISTTNYFYTNQGTNVNWTFAHTIRIYKNVNSTGVMNLQSPTIRLYDGNSGYYDLTANNHCQGVYWRMNQSTQTLLDIKTYEVSFSCDISNFKTSFPSVSLFQVIYSIDTPANIGGRITEDSFITTETPYTTQNDYTGTINSVGGNIINNQNQNTTTITNNDNRNTDRIIENQNANSQATIDAIEKQNKKCETYNFTYNNSNQNNNLNVGYIHFTNGDIRPDSNWRYSNYIAIDKEHTYILSGNALILSSASYCLYKKDKSLINCHNYESTSYSYNITPQEDGYIRYSLYLNQATYSGSFTGEYCYNLLEKQNEEQKAQNDYLMDNTPADYNIISGIQITSDTPISSLLTIPIRLIQAFLGNINGSCADYSFGSLYGTELKLKCADVRYIPTLLGNAYTIIDYLMCFFMIYNIFQLLVQAWNTITSLKDDFSNIYETKTYSNGEGFDY